MVDSTRLKNCLFLGKYFPGTTFSIPVLPGMQEVRESPKPNLYKHSAAHFPVKLSKPTLKRAVLTFQHKNVLCFEVSGKMFKVLHIRFMHVHPPVCHSVCPSISCGLSTDRKNQPISMNINGFLKMSYILLNECGSFLYSMTCQRPNQ